MATFNISKDDEFLDRSEGQAAKFYIPQPLSRIHDLLQREKKPLTSTMLPPVARARFERLITMFDLGDPDTLRLEMSKCCAIISGSAALYVFHPNAFTPGDVDFYVPHSTANRFICSLHDRGFFDNSADDKKATYPSREIVAVSRFWKRGNARSINLIITQSVNPLAVVVQFHSTLLMNAITGRGVICLYPLLTLPGRSVMMVDTPKARKCFAKYGRRGFRFQSIFASHECLSSAYCRNARRSLEDGDVLSVTFQYQPQSMNAAIHGLTPFHWQLGPMRS
ncbi:hypothetical protein CVT26_007745 [Gymnopilus dilepis]|uniref:Uncharacterized protein n=1 Tax=Gymnopilus dilepis TaxID=231916 RepID=A0A409WSH2_9AGAR|nr:hypothetical protein CVT26_007745 [Gymnopilus dilepis]